MGDPREGLTPDGSIRTGADASRIGASYRFVLDAAAEAVIALEPEAAVDVYGSVANGTATDTAIRRRPADGRARCTRRA